MGCHASTRAVTLGSGVADSGKYASTPMKSSASHHDTAYGPGFQLQPYHMGPAVNCARAAAMTARHSAACDSVESSSVPTLKYATPASWASAA
jgi:hypothetical protein